MLSKKMPYELDSLEVDCFYRAVDTDDHSGTVDDVAKDILDGNMDLWVWKTDDSTVVLTTHIGQSRDGHRELCVTMLAGTGGTKNQLGIIESLRKEASSCNCDQVIAFLKPDLFQKFGITDGMMSRFQDIKQLYVVIGIEV